MRNPSENPKALDEIVRFDLRLPQSLLTRIEDHAAGRHRSTSAQMRLAISEHLERAERDAA